MYVKEYANYNVVEHFWPFDSKGDQGLQGIQGIQGIQGLKGDPGGPKGEKGDDLRNIQLNNLTLKFNNATTDWDKLDVKPTSLFGDGCTTASETTGTKYVTMKNMMLQYPNVVPKTVGGNATIKFGKAGGVASGTWWEAGVQSNGDFQIAKEDNINNGGILLKTDKSINTYGALNVINDKDVIADFKKNDLTQGIGIQYNNIKSSGTYANQDIGLTPKGTGNVNVNGGLNVINDKDVIADFKKNDLTQGIGIQSNNIKATGTNTNQDINVTPNGTGNVNINGSLTAKNIYNSGMISNNGSAIPMTYSAQSFGTFWMIDTTGWIAYNANNAQLNIHHLVIWDSLTGSSYFGVVGFTASYPQDVVFLSSAVKNKGVQINVSFGYNGSGNSFIFVRDIPENNKLFYRIS